MQPHKIKAAISFKQGCQMSKYGRSIRIFLADGSPTGLRHVEIANWSGQALACPRSRFSELTKWSESKRPGVYFLIENSMGENNQAYIGESEDVFNRLTQHDRKKDFWNEVIIFTSKDENLTKSHIKYLEARLVEISKEGDRYTLLNGNTPTKSSLPRADCAAMEEFIDNIRLILGSLSHKVLEPVSVVTDEKTADNKSNSISNFEFVFSVSNLKAYGRITDDGFIILKGSQINLNSSTSMPGKSSIIKDRLIADNILVNKGDHLLLTKDKLMSSSSYAASLVAGNSRSGPQSWKTATGKLLKQVEEELIKTD